MACNQEEIENLLRIKGINAEGYGTIPKIVMRDKRLSCEAKSIYSYINSFAGSGTTAFPSVRVMSDELNLSIPRFYRHRLALIELNYIEVTYQRRKNRFGQNIYELVQNPVPLYLQKNNESTSGTDAGFDETEGLPLPENTKKRDGVNEQAESSADNLTELVETSGLSKELRAKLCEWITLKHKRKDDYSDVNIKALIEEARTAAQQSSDANIISLINQSIANNYKGILWEKLKPPKKIRATASVPEPLLPEDQEELEVAYCKAKGMVDRTSVDGNNFYYLWGETLHSVCDRLKNNKAPPKINGISIKASDVLVALYKGLSEEPDALYKLMERWMGSNSNNKYGYLISMIYNEFF